MLLDAGIDAFSSATTLLAAMNRGQMSAVELLEAHLRRVAQLDGPLNSIVVKDFDRARADAKKADELRAAGGEKPLLGLPVTIKESIDVEGLPSTAGVPFRKGHQALHDAPTVTRLREAGAVIFGKTNVCMWLADYQANNPIYGQTNSPWNLTRTPGGSSGGSASLAAGLTPLDIGTDLGGSIRIPAAFCGLWGHKPSHGIVCTHGHFPGTALPNHAEMFAIQGPHARSAADLELALDVMTGPEDAASIAWKLELPKPRATSLKSFRVGVYRPPDWLVMDPEILDALHQMTEFLRASGAKVEDTTLAPLGDIDAYYAQFRSLMWTTISIRFPDEHRNHVAEAKIANGERFYLADAQGLRATASDFLQWHEQREIYRAGWREIFKSFDVVLAPITPIPAFEHTMLPSDQRRFKAGGRDLDFEHMSFFPSLATLCGIPVTVFPAGITRNGLPIGLQAIGPWLEDRTTMAFAKAIEQGRGGFVTPPGYEKGF
jgi:amidase